MPHDRVHARPPHDPENWRVGTITALAERDGHAVFTVRPEGNQDGAASATVEPVELVVTLAVRDLVLRRLDADEPVGARVWFREHGGG
ncbi:hypothetical protein [Haloglomus litoreum]|uniref:DUF7861 family protein n=1 Tax=Haloglomus litoreum TaxID=3034026 RepID=UPI0023E89EB6|nr:hypothetical protein [Haloglomus sp. DT116]